MESTFFDFSTFPDPYQESLPPRYYYHPGTRSVPVFISNPRSARAHAPAGPSPPKQTKIVSIPVHFVGTEGCRSATAVKIQKVFRGFLVRRAVRKILEVRSEVEEIERRAANVETAERIRRDSKERSRLNEMLMSLLFRLDSIRGLDLGVRECRRRVSRSVIALQEKVDALTAENSEEQSDGEIANSSIDQLSIDENRDMDVEEGEENDEIQALGATDSAADGQLVLENDASSGHPDLSVDENQTVEVEDRASTECEESEPTASAADRDETLATVACAEIVNFAAIDYPAAETAESFGTGEREMAEMQSECDGPNDCHPPPETEAELLKENPEPTTEHYHSSAEEVSNRPGAESVRPQPPVAARRRSCGDYLLVMERMVEENVKLQQLLSELCERNEVQSGLINSLSQRVDQLERVAAR